MEPNLKLLGEMLKFYILVLLVNLLHEVGVSVVMLIVLLSGCRF